MRLSRFPFVITLLAAMLVCGNSYAGAKPDTLVYEVKVESSLGHEGTRKMYIKGSYFRWDYDSAGLKMTVINNKNGTFRYRNSGTIRFVGKYSPDDKMNTPMALLPGPYGDVKEFLREVSARKTASDKIDKKDCDVYSYVQKGSKAKCKLWVNRKTMAPAKLVILIPDGRKGLKRTVTYTSYKRGANVPDSLFELPKGVEVRDKPLGKGTAG